MYLGYAIGGGELKINLANMDVITKCPTHTNFNEVIIFLGEAQHLQKFIASFSVVVAPLHSVIASSRGF